MGQTPGGSLELTDAATGGTREVGYDAERSPFLGLVEAFSAATLVGEPDAVEHDLHNMRLVERLAAAVRDER
jgi:1,5-anhydro-D-fructose reductase (1,5-anhydro-D-mannitol-forming)